MIRVASALALAALAGCAPPPGPSSAAPTPMASTAPMPAPQAAAPAAGGSSGIDGVYHAPPGGVVGNSACRTTRFGYPIRVANGMASMQTVSQGQLTGPVGPDGSLMIQNGRASLSGQFSGNKFTGNYNVGRCGFAMNYTK